MTISTAPAGRLFLDCTWRGGVLPDATPQVCIVDLSLNERRKISIDLSKVDGVASQRLPFITHPESNRTLSDHLWGKPKQETADVLYLTADQIRKLTVTVTVFTPNKPVGPAIVDLFTGTITQHYTSERRARIVTLTIPEELEAGGIYTLQVAPEIASDRQFTLSAHLVKHPDSSAVTENRTPHILRVDSPTSSNPDSCFERLCR